MELGILIACAIISTLALLLSSVSIIMMIAKEKATHTIQMVPVDEEVERANEEYMSKWASSDKAIDEQNKLYKEDIENEMPEFSLSEEDMEKISI